MCDVFSCLQMCAFALLWTGYLINILHILKMALFRPKQYRYIYLCTAVYICSCLKNKYFAYLYYCCSCLYGFIHECIKQ